MSMCMSMSMSKIRAINFMLCNLFLCFICNARVLDLEYDKAIYAAQQGKWGEAKDKFKKLIVDRSQEPDVLYDSGVVSFENKDFEQAAAYFESVTENNKASAKLKEKAHFNLGSTNVELKKLEEAIKNYEAALQLNPDSKEAKHNFKIAKKILDDQDSEQEKSEQQQKQQNGGEQYKSKDRSQDSEQDKEGEQPRRDEQGNDYAEQQQWDKSETSKYYLDNERDEQQKQNGYKHDNKSEQKRQIKQDTNHSKEDKMETEKDQSLDTSPEEITREGPQEDPQDKPLSSEMPFGEEKRKKIDARTMKILKAVEDLDKEKNKEMMRATVEKNMAGKYGQNRW